MQTKSDKFCSKFSIFGKIKIYWNLESHLLVPRKLSLYFSFHTYCACIAIEFGGNQVAPNDLVKFRHAVSKNWKQFQRCQKSRIAFKITLKKKQTKQQKISQSAQSRSAVCVLSWPHASWDHRQPSSLGKNVSWQNYIKMPWSTSLTIRLNFKIM